MLFQLILQKGTKYMILHVSIYDDKEIDTKSEDFKKIISEAVKETILRDWNKIAKIEKHEELNNGKKEYLVNVEFRYE